MQVQQLQLGKNVKKVTIYDEYVQIYFFKIN